MTANERLKAELDSTGLSMREWYRMIYIKSEHWHTLRAAARSHHPKQCAACGKHTSLDAHHLRYRRIYDVTIHDLQMLCRPCHEKQHGQTPAPRKGKKRKRFTSGPPKHIRQKLHKRRHKAKRQRATASTISKRAPNTLY